MLNFVKKMTAYKDCGEDDYCKSQALLKVKEAEFIVTNYGEYLEKYRSNKLKSDRCAISFTMTVQGFGGIWDDTKWNDRK